MHTSNVGFVLCLLGVCLIRMFIGLVGEIETRSQEQWCTKKAGRVHLRVSTLGGEIFCH